LRINTLSLWPTLLRLFSPIIPSDSNRHGNESDRRDYDRAIVGKTWGRSPLRPDVGK